MNCEFTEKVSMLLDGELPEEELRQVTGHINTCSICRQARQDFLEVREQIGSYPIKRNPSAEQRALRKIIDAEDAPFWRRRVAVPAPAFAFLVLAVIALAAWAVVGILPAAQRPVGPTGSERDYASAASSPGGIDFSRYDRGERAVLYKTRSSKQ